MRVPRWLTGAFLFVTPLVLIFCFYPRQNRTTFLFWVGLALVAALLLHLCFFRFGIRDLGERKTRVVINAFLGSLALVLACTYVPQHLMNIGIWTASVVLGAGLLDIFRYDSSNSRQRATEWLAPWFLLAISAAVSGYVINEQAAVSAKSLKEQGRELTAARANASTYRDVLQAQILLPTRGGQPSTVHKVLLGKACTDSRDQWPRRPPWTSQESSGNLDRARTHDRRSTAAPEV